MRRWRAGIPAYHTRQLSNGRTEAMVGLCKKVKRIAFGFATSATIASDYCCTAALNGTLRPRQDQGPHPLDAA
ncbi:MAG: transposase [Actinobacteria bacterium]|nr:transposase [Actinomycetota bacterium]